MLKLQPEKRHLRQRSRQPLIAFADLTYQHAILSQKARRVQQD